LSLGFCNHSPPYPRGGLRRRCAPGYPAPGAYRRRFHVDVGRSRTFSSGTSRGPTVDIFTLMVGAPGPSALTPAVDVFILMVGAPRLSATIPPRAHRRRFHVDDGRYRIISSDTSRGPAVDVFTFMVGAPRSSAPTPTGGPLSTFSR
jgi:hypothetical protein